MSPTRKSLLLGLAALLVAAVAARPADGAPNTHQWVRVKNATAAPIKISYLSPAGLQLVEDLASGDYTDADVKRKDNNVVVQLVSKGKANQPNTKLTTPPPDNYPEMQIRVENATAASANISFYSLAGQQWSAVSPGTFLDVNIARGPAGYLLLQVVP